jgi:hypothetical protein
MASGVASFGTTATTYGRNPTDSFYALNTGASGTVVDGNLTVTGNATIDGDLSANTLTAAEYVDIGLPNNTVRLLPNTAFTGLVVKSVVSDKTTRVKASGLDLDASGDINVGFITGVTQIQGRGTSITNSIDVGSPLTFSQIPNSLPSMFVQNMFLAKVVNGSFGSSADISAGQASGNITFGGVTVQWGSKVIGQEGSGAAQQVVFNNIFKAGTVPVVVATCKFNASPSPNWFTVCLDSVQNDSFYAHAINVVSGNDASVQIWWVAIGQTAPSVPPPT